MSGAEEIPVTTEEAKAFWRARGGEIPGDEADSSGEDSTLISWLRAGQEKIFTELKSQGEDIVRIKTVLGIRAEKAAKISDRFWSVGVRLIGQTVWASAIVIATLVFTGKLMFPWGG